MFYMVAVLEVLWYFELTAVTVTDIRNLVLESFPCLTESLFMLVWYLHTFFSVSYMPHFDEEIMFLCV
jgi:hypothetical protein